MGDMSLFFLTELEGLRPYRNFIKNKEETEGTKVLPPGLGNKKERKKENETGQKNYYRFWIH
jgi:hypothetical protein